MIRGSYSEAPRSFSIADITWASFGELFDGAAILLLDLQFYENNLFPVDIKSKLLALSFLFFIFTIMRHYFLIEPSCVFFFNYQAGVHKL